MESEVKDEDIRTALKEMSSYKALILMASVQSSINDHQVK